MLILTRKVGESLIIDDRVTVTVMGVKGSQVRLGVDAPKEIKVYREEIFPHGAGSRTAETDKN